jgi:hypothetical protein
MITRQARIRGFLVLTAMIASCTLAMAQTNSLTPSTLNIPVGEDQFAGGALHATCAKGEPVLNSSDPNIFISGGGGTGKTVLSGKLGGPGQFTLKSSTQGITATITLSCTVRTSETKTGKGTVTTIPTNVTAVVKTVANKKETAQKRADDAARAYNDDLPRYNKEVATYNTALADYNKAKATFDRIQAEVTAAQAECTATPGCVYHPKLTGLGLGK